MGNSLEKTQQQVEETSLLLPKNVGETALTGTVLTNPNVKIVNPNATYGEIETYDPTTGFYDF